MSVDTLILLYNIIFFISGMIFCINSFLPFLWLFVEQLQMFVPMAGLLLPGCTSRPGETNQKSWIQTTAKWSSHLFSSLSDPNFRLCSSLWWIISLIRLKFLHFTTGEIFVFTEDSRCYFLRNSSFFFPANCKHFWGSR